MKITYQQTKVLSQNALEVLFTDHPHYSSSIDINGLTKTDFEDAVLELAEKIKKDRLMQNMIKDIIQKLVI